MATLFGIGLAVVTCVSIAIVAAPLGLKGLAAVVVGLGLVVLLVLAGRWREEVLLFGLVLATGLLVHKSIGSIRYDVNGGAPAIYVTSTSVVLALLCFLWFVEGTLIDDLRIAFGEQKVLLAPLVGGLFLLPSILPASQPNLVAAEIVRMGWMYVLFVYLACRVRTRLQVLVVLGGLASLAALEFVVVVGQWITGSTLGLGFLGLPPALGERILSDSGRVLRPFGTVTHPVFMGAVVGALAVLFLALALHVRNPKLRALALAMSAISAVPLVIAHTRAATLGVAIASILLVVIALTMGRLRARPFFAWVCVGAVAVVVLWGPITEQFGENWGTNHFSLEVESRNELNVVAYEMFVDHPLNGAGLNQFQEEMDRYDTLGLIFAGNPVHNIYLLYLAETGVLGLIGVLVVGIALLRAAIRVARSTDTLYSAIGFGMIGVVCFFAVQEMLLFSLRLDHPLTLFWLLAGLTVASSRLAARSHSVPDTADELAIVGPTR